MNTPRMLTVIIRSAMFMKQDCTNTVSPRSCSSSGHIKTSSNAFEKEQRKETFIVFLFTDFEDLG